MSEPVTQRVPKHGLLSGMVLTAAAAAVVPLAIALPTFRAAFAAPLTPELLYVFIASCVVMGVHKAESFLYGEFDACPVYWTVGQDVENPRKAIFGSFVTTFLGMLVLLCFAFAGPPWHLVLLTIWLGQGLHETHHLAKSLSRRRVYPGLLSSLLFVAIVVFALFPRWHDAIFAIRGGVFYGYYAALPLVVLAFYLEDRAWTLKAGWQISSGSLDTPIPGL